MTKLPGYNGDQSWELPVPATFVVAPDGKIFIGERMRIGG